MSSHWDEYQLVGHKLTVVILSTQTNVTLRTQIDVTRRTQNLITINRHLIPVTGRGRKQWQMFVPAYLVATQLGYYLLALKFVSVLAIKALLVSKFALIVAAMVVIRRVLMDPMNIR